MKKDLLVPDIGDFENVEIIELLVKQGQKISINDPIVTLESDKSSVEVPSTEEGIVESISVKMGDKVSKCDLLLDISTFNNTSSSLQNVPKNTENLILEAENSLKKEQDRKNKIILVTFLLLEIRNTSVFKQPILFDRKE